MSVVTDAADHPAAGLSLVEMLVVLVVLALAAGLGGPALRTLIPRQRLDAAAEALAHELSLLRAEAVRTGHRTSLVFDPENGRFLSSRRTARPMNLTPLAASVETPPESRSAPGEIRFLPGGGATGGRIVLVGTAGERVLTVSRVTGAVRRGEAMP